MYNPTKTTYHKGDDPPTLEAGLPGEIHFWCDSQGSLFILRDGVWFRWNSGVAVKDVGKHSEHT